MDEEKLPAPTTTLYERHNCGNIISTKIIFAELDMTIRNGPFQMISIAQWQTYEPTKATAQAKGTIDNVSFDGIGHDERGFYCLQCNEKVIF